MEQNPMNNNNIDSGKSVLLKLILVFGGLVVFLLIMKLFI